MKKLRLPKRRHLYVLASPDLPWRAKIGISDDARHRRREVEDSISGHVGRRVKVVRVFSARTYFARLSETAIKRATTALQTDTVPGSGATEWRWTVNALSCILLLLAAYAFKKSPAWAVVVLIAPFPLDLLLFALLMSCIDWLLGLGILYLTFKLLV